jgi:hypothetical protein
MLMLLKTFIPFLAIAPAFAAWDVTSYAVIQNITTGWLPDYEQSDAVFPTAPLTVSPTSTMTSSGDEYLIATENGNGRAVVEVTTTYLLLPPATDLPTESSIMTEDPSIFTYYYVPVTVSNPESCTKTDFTYTDTIGISLPDSLTAKATDSDLALFVTTYESTISTNLGGQAVTTSICEVYFKSDAVPVGEPDIDVDDAGYLDECVDPRRELCTSPGQNHDATGSGGCVGTYPPTQGSNGGSPTEDDSSSPTETGGAVSLREQKEWWGLILSGFVVVSLLVY